jgi:Na+/proline symporter
MPSTVIVATAGVIITTFLAVNNEAAKSAGTVIKELSDLQWSTFPFVGALFASIMSVLFKKNDWKENAARFIAATVVGVGVPRLVTYMHPSLKEWSADPIILIMFGFAWGMVGFALAKWGFSWLNRRGPEIAEIQAEDWAHRRSKKTEKNQWTDQE